MAKTVTQTATHYDVQKKRRAAVIEEWQQYRRTVIRADEVKLEYSPSRRMSRGVYMGRDGSNPTKVLDATLHEIPAATVSTVHRHSWDAIMFVTQGSGWTEIDGQRVHWRPWDTLHLPAWAWHRHGNETPGDARFVTWSVQPMHESLGMAMLEDAGDTAFDELPAPPRTVALVGTDPYAQRTQRLAQTQDTSDRRLITRWDDVEPRVTKRGARSVFLVDQSIGYQTSGLSAVMHELAPALWQSRHRHGGEAWLHVVSGHGHSDVDDTSYEWGPGDLVVVDHWAWHQHFNDDKQNTARLVRVHNFDALYDMMRILMDPLDLWSELPKLDAPDLSGVVWPDKDAGRPD